MNARPPIIDFDKQAQFRDDVFSNFDRILGHEHRLLAALYERQREQHPVITSIADIVLDVALAFLEDYESYIKVGYPVYTMLREKINSCSRLL
jgi:RHO1 GDP-GTP exchange protein 1/2